MSRGKRVEEDYDIDGKVPLEGDPDSDEPTPESPNPRRKILPGSGWGPTRREPPERRCPGKPIGRGDPELNRPSRR